jgi:hypothetical protein
LKREKQVAFENRRVNNIYDSIRLLKRNVISGNQFLHRKRRKRINSRQVNDRYSVPLKTQRSLGSIDGFAWPIADYLVRTSDLVEDDTFANIRVSCQSKSQVVTVFAVGYLTV